MLTKTLLFIMGFLSIFSILFAGIHASFYANQGVYSATAGDDPTAPSLLDVANVTIYHNNGTGNMSYSWSSYHDHPNAPQHQTGLPDGQFLEVWWGQIGLYKCLQFRHTTEQWWGLAFDAMDIYGRNGSLLSFTSSPIPIVFHDRIVEDVSNPSGEWNLLSDNWDDTIDAAIFTTHTPVSSSILLTYNETAYDNITHAWNNNEISYTFSYELDVNATQMSIWGLMGAILTFHTPALGMGSSVAGLVLNAMIAIPFWVGTAIAIAKIVFAIIPFVRGIEE